MSFQIFQILGLPKEETTHLRAAGSQCETLFVRIATVVKVTHSCRQLPLKLVTSVLITVTVNMQYIVNTTYDWI